MTYRTSKPLHPTEDSSPKPIKVVGENLSAIKRDNTGRRYSTIVEDTAYLKAGTKIYGINKKSHQTDKRGKTHKGVVIGGDYQATKVGQKWKLLK